MKFDLLVDKCFCYYLVKLFDGIIIFLDVKIIFGGFIICILNGIDFDLILFKK